MRKEDPKLRDRYGRGSPKNAGYGDAGPLLNDYFLAARRLVEAGVRVRHPGLRPLGLARPAARHELRERPRPSAGCSTKGSRALIEDLERPRHADDDVSVVVWGEFGRTPRINKNGGRDHWPHVACALLAGGGMKTGQVIGATNRLGEHAKDRPVHFQEVFATLYHNLGIDVNRATVNDLAAGRSIWSTTRSISRCKN